jgi:hypothetical protein
MSGTEIFPSGLTGAVTDSSGLRHTDICNLSSAPMRYSSAPIAVRSEASGSTGVLSHPTKSQAAAMAIHHDLLICYLALRPLL